MHPARRARVRDLHARRGLFVRPARARVRDLHARRGLFVRPARARVRDLHARPGLLGARIYAPGARPDV